MMQSSPCAPIPPLNQVDGQWVTESYEKANLFASTFISKFTLPVLEINAFSQFDDNSPVTMSGFLPVRVRHAERILKQLDDQSATGPDHLSTRILKFCCVSLALPISLIARSILNHGIWPRCWCLHWVFPLFKKRSKFDPGNYRGIHLTTQVSKVMERLLGKLFLPFLDKSGAFGINQFAYRQKHSFMDALAWNVMSWITAFMNKRKIALYCSDVSGAFDRVTTERLLEKLRRKGVREMILKVLSSWLQERKFSVIVNGTQSKWHELRDSVYQGTVWGPPLWNCFL